MFSRLDGEPLNSDRGIMFMLREYVEDQVNPRAREMARKVQRGQRLDDDERAHLDHVLEQMRKLLPLLDSHPEEQKLVAAVIGRHDRLLRPSGESSLRGRWILRTTVAARRFLTLRWFVRS